MNQSREYRRIQLTRKLFTGNPWVDGLLDQQDASNRRKAIEMKLDQQDREYQEQQRKKVDNYMRKLG